MADYFLKKLEDTNMFDIPLAVLIPTWRNMRLGAYNIAKNVDIFIINEGILHGIPVIKQWVGEGGESNHFPNFIEHKGDNHRPPSLFKFMPNG